MKTTEVSAAEEADWLLTPDAVRERAGFLFELAQNGKLDHFRLLPEKLADAADFVAATIRENYPDLKVPPHARWRHFVFEGTDRFAARSHLLPSDPLERARVECEIAITSVLLDAGAGAAWAYTDPETGKSVGRSEGLALASLAMFFDGAFLSDPAAPLRADGERLAGFAEDDLQQGFQISDANPLEGAEGRAALLKRVGDLIIARPDHFPGGRLGGLVDFMIGHAGDKTIPANLIVLTMLHALGRIWPDRIILEGRNLGDTWWHGKIPGSGLIPFHKLSQWISYSLFEPMERLGYAITEQDRMTGLAEYRNGGLFLDLGVLELTDSSSANTAFAPGDEIIVEWRALTIALLDAIAPLVRERLNVSADAFPMAAVLEGGTWAAGRKIAKSKRTGGPPPLNIVSDGSVF
ncbi:MAG: URC4/urg3 family protein [Pseudomonadota bacterium]